MQDCGISIVNALEIPQACTRQAEYSANNTVNLYAMFLQFDFTFAACV